MIISFSNLQGQVQLFCTGALYCDFVVHTKEGNHVEHIKPGPLFMEKKW